MMATHLGEVRAFDSSSNARAADTWGGHDTRTLKGSTTPLEAGGDANAVGRRGPLPVVFAPTAQHDAREFRKRKWRMGMNPNHQTADTIAINALLNRGYRVVNDDQVRLIRLVSDIISGVLEGERRDLANLSARVQHIIRNVPHSCQTDTHCCALHQAHERAAEGVKQAIEELMTRVGGGDGCNSDHPISNETEGGK